MSTTAKTIWKRFDVGETAGRCPQEPTGTGDHLFEAVVADRYVLPSGLEEVILGDDLTRAGDEKEQDIELPVGYRYGFPVPGQSTSNGSSSRRLKTKRVPDGTRQLYRLLREDQQ